MTKRLEPDGDAPRRFRAQIEDIRTTEDYQAAVGWLAEGASDVVVDYYNPTPESVSAALCAYLYEEGYANGPLSVPLEAWILLLAEVEGIDAEAEWAAGATDGAHLRQGQATAPLPTDAEMANDAYHDDDQFEDPDLHLGRRKTQVYGESVMWSPEGSEISLGPLVGSDPINDPSPTDMIEAARKFIAYYVQQATDDDDIDERCDVALFEWNAWVGRAFNDALALLGLNEGYDQYASKQAARKDLTWKDVRPPPSPNRKEHPFVGTIKFRGLEIHVENDAGDVREGVGEDGILWSTTMVHPYGEIHRSEGVDGEKVDVYVGPDEQASEVFVVHQNNPDTGEYDEDKVMLGFATWQDAREGYLVHFDDPRFFRSITIWSWDDFVRVVLGDQGKGEKLAGLWLLAAFGSPHDPVVASVIQPCAQDVERALKWRAAYDDGLGPESTMFDALTDEGEEMTCFAEDDPPKESEHDAGTGMIDSPPDDNTTLDPVNTWEDRSIQRGPLDGRL